MNPTSRMFRGLGLALALAMLSGLAWAAPRVTRVEFHRGETGQAEILTIATQGGLPVIQTLRFPEAQMATLLLRGVESDVAAGALAGGSLLQSAELQPLTGVDGRPALRITLRHGAQAEFDVQPAENRIEVRFFPSNAAPAAPEPVEVISNEDLEDLDGAVTLMDPGAEGYGQDATKGVLQGFQFYTPEDLPREQAAASADKQEEMLLQQEVFQRRVTLDFKDADLQNVIRALAKKAGINLILTRDQVRGTVTLQLTNVRLGAALDSILKTNSLAYIIEPGGIVRIVPRSQVKTETIETKTEKIPVNWINASSVVKTLNTFLSDNGKMQAHNESNTVIVSDTPEKIKIINDLVQQIDVPEKQVMIEARLVDMTEAASRDLGIEWAIRNAKGSGLLQVSRLTNTSLNRLELGTAPDPANNIAGSPALDFSAFGSDFTMDAVLDFLEERRLADVLANPTIVTLNNIRARIEIIRNIPYISAQQTGQNSIGTVSFKETGVILEVVPNITNNGYVRMTLAPEQKVRKGDAGGFGQTSIPIVDERKVESNVIVKDEETVVLGGLRQLDNSISEKGVPWLMRVPVLGFLFRSTETDFEKTRLILFITPHIIKDPTLSPEELRKYELVDYNWDLPDYFYDETRLRDQPKGEEVKK